MKEMRLPVPPPVLNAAPAPLEEEGNRLALDSRGRYLPWDKVRYLQEAGGSQSKARELWIRMKRARRLAYRQLPFLNVNGRPFVFCPLDLLNEFQHWMDQQGGGLLMGGGQPGPEQERQKYILRSLTDEAVHSSQLEGAATTAKDAREMLRKNRKPRTDGEKMIANNYAAMQFIRDEAGARKLTPRFCWNCMTLSPATLCRLPNADIFANATTLWCKTPRMGPSCIVRPRLPCCPGG